MTPQTTLARSIARPLLADLTAHAFSGRVLGLFNRACNLIDDSGRIIALVLPAVGNGPFAISLDGSPGMFDELSPNLPARATRRTLTIARWQIRLGQAEIWEPRIDGLELPPNLDFITEFIKPYDRWPDSRADTPAARRMAQSAARAAAQLNEAITQSSGDESLAKAVAQLAGLGRGLTPAGDDYLLGSMAALWLAGHKDILPLMAETAIPKTTALSQAFLKSAAKGEFMEPWHSLVEAWLAGDKQAMAKAVGWIANFGASSGTDALAGFSKTLLSLTKNLLQSDK